MEKPPPLFLISIHFSTAAQQHRCALTQIPLADSGSANLRRKAVSLFSVCLCVAVEEGYPLKTRGKYVCKPACPCVFSTKLVLQACIVGRMYRSHLLTFKQGLIGPRLNVPIGLPL